MPVPQFFLNIGIPCVNKEIPAQKIAGMTGMGSYNHQILFPINGDCTSTQSTLYAGITFPDTPNLILIRRLSIVSCESGD